MFDWYDVVVGFLMIILFGLFGYLLFSFYDEGKENQLVLDFYKDEIVDSVKTRDGKKVVSFVNGDTRVVSVSGGIVEELKVESQEVKLKKESIDELAGTLSVAGQQQDSEEEVRLHYQQEGKMILQINRRENNEYLVELVDRYVLIAVEAGVITEKETEMKSRSKS